MSEPSHPTNQFPLTIHTEQSAEITVRKSRFIAFLAPCRSKEEAAQYLSVLRQTYWDAAHHCYAYRLGADGSEYRMSDDGEPSGTAGKPLLFCLQRARLTQCVLVVVRYFGGVKLGVGPLARAYADAAAAVFDAATFHAIIPMATIELYCMYDDISTVIELLNEVGAQYETIYADAVTFQAQVPEHQVEALTTAVVDRTMGRAGFSKIST